LEVREYLAEENRILLDCMEEGSSLVDFGCGFGRHLNLVGDKLAYGLGIDLDEARIREGQNLLRARRNIELRVADARATGLEETFDYAICMNNTLGNIEEKKMVIDELSHVVKPHGTILVAVYSMLSIIPRIGWYQRTGLTVTQVTEHYIQTEEGFKSDHFSEERIRQLLPYFDILKITDFGYLVTG
jgi:SAM-dependent methyltransferase